MALKTAEGRVLEEVRWNCRRWLSERGTLEVETWVEVQILVMTKCTGFVTERTWRLGSLKGGGEDQGQMQSEIMGKCMPN